MSQINKYNVQRITPGSVEQDLSTKDEALISSYSLGSVPFIVGKYRLDASFYTPDDIYLETVEDVKTYSVLGTNKGESATEISVDPVQDALDQGYLGDVQIEYKVTDNLFSPSHDKDSEAVLFIREISTDRTEIRATSTTLTEEQMQSSAQALYRQLNLASYFKGVKLNFIDEQDTESWCINVMTEVIDSNLIVTFKTYEPLPNNVGIKSRFQVLEQIGEPVKFEVIRTVEVTEDEDTLPRLKGPNFDVEVPDTELGIVTDYLNFKELFSYPEDIKAFNLYSVFKEKGVQLSIDHSDFANFIHFSSAAERLENFRYKLGLIQGYEHELELEKPEAEKIRIKGLIRGIIDNFDHYDRYLYFEKTDTSWPKIAGDKPYINVSIADADFWFVQMLEIAQGYDSNNPDILINTVPKAIREDDRNEPYIIFVHMIGQMFDDQWVYAKAVSERYSGDNRLDFGISKDLVRDTLKSFGVELETTNQNLNKLFDQCVPGETYNTGSESSVNIFKRITTGTSRIYDGEYVEPIERHSVPDLDGGYVEPYDHETGRRVVYSPEGEIVGYITGSDGEVLGQLIDAGYAFREWPDSTEYQPILEDDYRKEIYKRIYHNIPLLLKTKGTSRGLRALINCFGIPDDFLEISVAGGANLDQAGPFFGPEYYTTSSLGRVRLDETGSKAPMMFDETTGTFISGTVLSLDRQIEQPGTTYQHGTNNVQVGFRLNAQFDRQVKNYLIASSSQFDYDDIVGDPRNIGEDYGTAFTLLRNQIIPELRGDNGELNLRTPTAILRLIRYYDSVLFRTLQQFVPARDVVSTGAIIDDNILHRNKYGGVEPLVKNLEIETGSIEMVFIDGGEAGCLKVLKGPRPGGKAPQVNNLVIQATAARTITESRACPTVDYVESGTVSIGARFVDKVVFDDSPRYNGELAGTTETITNGELNEDNRFKKGGSSSKKVIYNLDYRFLCLPRFPIDTVLKAAGSLKGWKFVTDVTLSPNHTDPFALVNGISVRGDIILNRELAPSTEFILKCPNNECQGWLGAVKATPPVAVRYANYIGADWLVERWAKGDPNILNYENCETRRVLDNSGSYTLLLTEPNRGEDIMRSRLALANENYNYWNQFKGSSRVFYARTYDKDVNRTLTLSFSPDGWALPFRGHAAVPFEKASEAKLYTLNYRGKNIPLEKLVIQEPQFNNHSLRKIFLFVREIDGFVIVDFRTSEFRRWKVSEGRDWRDWRELKGYQNVWPTDAIGGTAKVEQYLVKRYVLDSGKFPIVVLGVEVADNITGVQMEGEVELLTLMESYMGCPYIFSQGLHNLDDTGKFQMLMENWL